MRHKKRIVVLDDDEFFRAMMQAVLGYDYTVVPGGDGEEGLKLCAEPTDLVITDIGMPNMDGVEFIMRLKRVAATASIPIIVLTATHWGTNSSKELEKDRRVKAILRKPFETEHLLNTVHSVLPPESSDPS